MDLTTILQKYPGLRLARTSDNDALLHFFSKLGLGNQKLQFVTDRSPDFFELLRYYSESSYVCAVFEKEEILSAAAITIRKGYIHGELKTVGYLGDFRSSFNRNALKVWRGFFSDLLEHSHEIKEFEGCRNWVTAVIDENAIAKRALLQSKRGNHRYDLLAPYWMVNVPFKLLPAFNPLLKQFRVRAAQESERTELEGFMKAESQKQAFGFDHPQEMNRRLKVWEGLKLSSFLIARDGAGKIVGCVCPWSPVRSKRIVIKRLPFLLKCLSLIVPGIREDSHLKTIYLTHLFISNREELSVRRKIFRSLFEQCYKEGQKQGRHLISFCDLKANAYHRAIPDYFKQRIEMSLFTVRHSEQPAEVWEASEITQPGFEIALV